MTDHADISRRLALAIGWKEDFEDPDLVTMGTTAFPEPCAHVWVCDAWKRFDYRDPAVIFPIAERFNTFPLVSADGWTAWFDCTNAQASADTAALAVALAVIKAKESK